jgi:voltage-gated potassium channel
MGRCIAAEFEAQNVPYVVVDKDAAELEEFQATHGLTLHGDATDDHVLKKAGIDRARALVAVTGEDAANLYIALSARLLSDKLLIIARAEGQAAEAKLRKVGVNQVLSPYVIGGLRATQAVLRPAVIDFLDLALSREHLALKIEEVPLKAGSPLCGKTLAESRVRQDLELIVVGIQRPRGGLLTNPPGDTVLEAGHTLIALGHSQQVDRLRQLAEGRA